MAELKSKIQGVKKYVFQKEILFFLGLMCMGLCITFFTAQGFQMGKAESIISGIVLLVSSILIVCYKIYENKLHILTWITIFFLGILSVFIQPILNIPDEQTHFARAEMVSRGVFYINPDEQQFDSIESYIELKEERQIPYTQSEIKGKKINTNSKTVTHVAATNATFLYFPQAIGILCAKIFNADIIWMLWLGRLFNLFWYAMLIGLAVKIAPEMKILILFVASLPISIQQAASFSPDATINGLSLLLIAYFLKLYCDEDKKIHSKEITLFGLLSILVILSKVTNIFIAGLFLLLPESKFKDKKGMFISKILILVLAIAVGGGYYFYTTTFAPNIEAQAFLGEANVDAAKQIQYIINNFFEWLRNFMGAMINQSEEYIRMLNWFGCLDYKYSVLSMVCVFMFGKLCFQDVNIEINRFRKILIFLMIMGIYGFSCLALYISWTPVGTDYIDGIQGRYFIPLIAMIPLLFAKNTRKSEEHKHIGDYTVLISMIGIMLIATACRYY